jgi:putative ABC transport system permease protein
MIYLSTIDLIISAALVLVAGIISVVMKLGLERRLFIAAVRAAVQLLLLGFVLKIVFGLDNPWVLLPLGLFMVFVAARAAIKRSSYTFKGITGLSFITLAACGIITTFTVTGAVLKVDPWYSLPHVIPFLGMILGNSLTGISLGVDSMLEALRDKSNLIEMELSLGATRWEAARDVLTNGVRRGMIPTINSMIVVGIVFIPGMMTGQVLAGIDPLEAAKYQIVVMFMLTASTAIGCIMIAFLIYRALFNSRHQLEMGKILKQDG